MTAAVAQLEIRDSRFTSVVGESLTFETLGSGFLFTEGPVWHPVEQHLTFSDMPGDVMRRWDAASGVTTFRQPCAKSNGMAYDGDGHLLICEHASSRVTRMPPGGGPTQTLASHWQGRELNSPNDIVCARDGTIYFTDPTYGRAEYYGVPRETQLGFKGLYRLDRDGQLDLVADDFGQPNGLCLSLDERLLYVNDTERQHIRVFDRASPGSAGHGRVWAETTGVGAGAPDGMKMDLLGNIYCCGPGGIHVFAPDAACLGVVAVPEYVANFCWGDADYRSLFVTASTSLYRMRTRIPGRPVF